VVEMSTNQSGKMMIAIVLVVVIASAGYSFIYLSGELGPTTTTTTIPTIPDVLPINQPIIIKNDTDFDVQADIYNWSGNGESVSPYKIENLSIVNDTPCIYIANTNRHFIIRNCSLKNTAESHINRAAIWLRNCTCGTVESCNIVSQGQGVELFFSNWCTVLDCTIEACGPGINITLSKDIQLSLNSIFNCIWGIFICGWSNIDASNNSITDSECGIISAFTNHCRVESNIISRNQIGLDIQMCSNWYITHNSIVDNGDIGIKIDGSSDNILFMNKIGWNNVSNALDDGINNQWDNSESLGNLWSDYEGTGQYSILGSAGSIDHYPDLLEREES
jgi:parallel beta-helix repeat protein